MNLILPNNQIKQLFNSVIISLFLVFRHMAKSANCNNTNELKLGSGLFGFIKAFTPDGVSHSQVGRSKNKEATEQHQG
jgi:hypothetical protein